MNSDKTILQIAFVCLFVYISGFFHTLSAQNFTHPGVLHTQKEMERIRTLVNEKSEPAYGSYLLLKEHKCAQADYQPEGPFSVISRDGEYRHTKSKMEADFSAAYLNSLMWIITGNEAHARKSLDILNAYANTLTTIPNTNDAPLLVGLEGFKIIYALEILKHTYPEVSETELADISRMFKNIFLPVMENFYSRKAYTNGNWGPIVTKAYMAAGIFFDDRKMYEKAKDFYLNAHDNGTIRNYISETGQIQESGRDQSHCMLGIGAMATVCELAWHQGDDLWSALDNRLMKGYEYVAKYNLGDDVPFATWTDITGKYSNWTEISDKGRGRFMPVFEIAYNHYVNRKGLSMPYTHKVLEKIRPEGYDRDQPGFGALLFNSQCDLKSRREYLPYTIESPDGKVKVLFTTGVFEGQQMTNPTNTPFYQVYHDGKPFIHPSRMGLNLDGMPSLSAHLSVTGTNIREHRSSWKPLYGEKDEYPDNYNELTVELKETIPPRRTMRIVFRAYNEGAAFRYEVPVQSGISHFRILDENTEYAFEDGTYVWEEHGHEGLYFKKPSSDIEPDCELPLTVQTANGIYGTIAEAGAFDYPRAYVDPIRFRNRKSNAVRIALRSDAEASTPFASRWRTITLGSRPGALMEQNYLLLNLNEPNQIADVSWIRPGKAFREVTQTTENGIKAVDFAVRQGIDYIIFDWGWYGPHNDESNEPSSVNVVSPGTGKPIEGHTGLDLQKVIDYGKSKGVGVFLYVNRQGLERYMDVIFPLYQSWGIAGVKAGFVHVGSQGWNKWNEEMVKKAAEHQLLVNIHDAYRPTGFSRTYPNLLTQEGIHGNEQNPDASHSATLPFVRFTIGAGDFTPGYFKKALKTSWAHKLSLPILFYSPAQFLFWVERLDEQEARPELALWKDIPTTWDDTKVLTGEIGEYAIVARRKEKEWYVGGITNNDARSLELSFDFLDPQKKYDITVYTDAPDGSKVNIEQKKRITNNENLSFSLIPSGGFVVKAVER